MRGFIGNSWRNRDALPGEKKNRGPKLLSLAVYCLYLCIRARTVAFASLNCSSVVFRLLITHHTISGNMMGYLSLSRAEVQFAIYMQCVAVLPTRNEFARQLADVLYLEVLTNRHFCVCRVHMHT